MKTNYELAAFDMDGTLLNSSKEILPSTKEAFARALSAGKILTLATGRSVSELLPFPLTDMGIRYGACASGTVLYDFLEQKVLARKTLPAELIPTLVTESRKEDLMFLAMVDGIAYAEPSDIHRMDHFLMSPLRSLYEQYCSTVSDVRAFVLASADRVNKINFYHADPAGRARSMARLSHLPLDLIPMEIASLEITPSGASKGTGLLDLCDFLGIAAEKAIGVGDGLNDIPLLKAAGLGIAMGNSCKAVQDAADAVVSDNDHYGIMEIIDRYLLR